MYWGGPDRHYRLTKKEQNGEASVCCPKCKEPMDVHPFTRKEKLYSVLDANFTGLSSCVSMMHVFLVEKPHAESMKTCHFLDVPW